MDVIDRLRAERLLTRSGLLWGAWSAALSAAALAVAVAVVKARGRPNLDGLFNDFYDYWAAGRILQRGGNPYDVARVAVLPGAQHLDGIHALEYVRSRHGDIRGDFGRSERQQQVLLALRAKARGLSFANVPDLAAALSGQVSTDMGIRQIGDLLPLIGGINIDSVKRIILLPPYTQSAQIAGQDVLLPEWSRIRPLVAQSFPS